MKFKEKPREQVLRISPYYGIKIIHRKLKLVERSLFPIDLFLLIINYTKKKSRIRAFHIFKLMITPGLSICQDFIISLIISKRR